MSQNDEVRFPCEALPGEGRVARLLGIYPQRQPGFFMQRVRIPGGRLEAAQLIALAQLARHHAPDYPLHLTTRQDIEIHGLTREIVPDVQRGIAAAGLTGLDTCGDTMRNVTTCPRTGLCPGMIDLAPLADAIRQTADALPWIRQLPRKFKISLSGCDKACGRPWINDLGFIAQGSGRFKVVVAGSLGARPGTGLLLDKTLDPKEVVPFVVAALRLFHAEGDRTNRKQARLRHVRERLGDSVFTQKLLALFDEERAASGWPVVTLAVARETLREQCRLHLPLGDISAEKAIALGKVAEKAKAELRLGFEHEVFVYAGQPVDLSFLGDLSAFTKRAVSCPGTTWCSLGIADSRAAATIIREALRGDEPLNICLSGCPNGCSHPAVADIGLVGRIKTINGVRTDCFRLFLGGGHGSTPALGIELHEAVPAAKLPAVIAWLQAEYQNARSAHESLTDFVTREKDRLAQAIVAMVGA